MTINTDLLIAAPMLQDYFVDKSTGAPLAAGVVTCYSNTNQSVLKNWYYQTGSAPGSYDYLPLSNPLTLSASGTITDPDGNDVIPFFYPVKESDNSTPEVYYITVVNSQGTSQFVRYNFPFIPETDTSTDIPTLENLIVNKEFWRNSGTVTLTNPSATLSYFPAGFNYAATLAPSQHDGFLMPDMQFIKNVQGGQDVATFSKFALGYEPFSNTNDPNDISPEYYLNHQTNSIQAGETLKVYQWPISFHIQNLQGSSGTATIWLQNNGGAETTLQLYIFQHLGSGVVSPSSVAIGNPITLSAGTTTWTKYVVSFTFPEAPASVSTVNDDAFYFQLGLPLSTECNFNFCKPSIYLGNLKNNTPTNDLWTYDQIDAVISSAHTGDIKQTFRTMYDINYVAANDGTIGSASSNASTRANADTWPLYSVIWNQVTNVNPLFAPIIASDGTIASVGTSAYEDFVANKQVTLGRILGQVLAGTIPFYPAAVAITNNTATPSVFTLGSGTVISKGLGHCVPIVFTTGGGGTLPTGILSNTIYYCGYATGLGLASNEFVVAETLDDAIAGVYITVSSSGTSCFVQVNPYGQGGITGEQRHKLTIAEMPAHNHPGSLPAGTVKDGSTGGTPYYTADAGGAAMPDLLITTQGGDAYHNNFQPTTFLNTYIKL
jgi:hypothetical protein